MKRCEICNNKINKRNDASIIDLTELDRLRELETKEIDILKTMLEYQDEKINELMDGSIIKIERLPFHRKDLLFFHNPNNLKEVSEIQKIYDENDRLRTIIKKLKNRNLLQRIFNY